MIIDISALSEDKTHDLEDVTQKTKYMSPIGTSCTVPQPVTLAKKPFRHEPKWFVDLGKQPNNCDTNTVTTASTIRTERTNDAHIASVTITTDTAINKQFHQQTSHEIDSADYVTFPRIFRETPCDDDHKDEMLRELESKLRHEPSEEQPIFTTA
jgi:hypothetical protein